MPTYQDMAANSVIDIILKDIPCNTYTELLILRIRDYMTDMGTFQNRFLATLAQEVKHRYDNISD